MPRPEFKGPYAKLSRAAHFIRELEDYLAHHRDAHRKSAKVERSNNGVARLLFDSGQELHPSLIIGDTIHNLRAALDLMASDLADLNGQDRHKVKFPFSISAAELDGQIRGKNFDLTGADAVTLLKRIAPYRGGNQMLRDLHDLDIQDKHTTLIFTTTDWAWGYDTDDITPEGPGYLHSFKFDYLFPKDSVAFPGEPVLPSLKQLVQAVERVLEAFASLVAARAP